MTRLNVTVFLFFLFGQLVNAQEYYLDGDSVNFEFRLPGTNPALGTSYCNGKPCEGELTRKDSNGNIVLIEQVRNGKGNGFYKIFYSNGSIREIGQHKDNFVIGLRIRYYKSGELESVEHFPEEALGIIDGTEKISFYANGNN
jgi:antitoxin component YwqK of YwqJK toxin-antitoxin module